MKTANSGVRATLGADASVGHQRRRSEFCAAEAVQAVARSWLELRLSSVRIRPAFALLAAGVTLGGCAVKTAEVDPSSAAPAPTTTVMASYYGPGFHGRRTASGEPFNRYGLTAAHRTLPFGTKLLIVNPDNGREVVVRVNDRGPFTPRYSLDLSEGAALRIGRRASGPVQISALD